jgi:hypothetical protein
MQKISIGRIVHFVLPNGEHRPAIVVRVWPEEFPNNSHDHTGLNLQVFLDGANDNEAYRGMELPAKIDLLHGTMWYTNAQYAPPPPEGERISDPGLPEGVAIAPFGTWHWPERIE